MRTTLLGNNGQAPTAAPAGSFIAALPSDLKAVMVPVTKYTNNIGIANYADSITATEDYVWLPAETEVHSYSEWAGGYEGYQTERYDFYAAGNSMNAFKHTDTKTGAYKWLRSPRCSESGVFVICSADGGVTAFVANKSCSITPCFAV